jgi:hypothetical protein
MTDALQPQFAEVLALIQTAQQKVIAAANQELIKLYWNIGRYISDRLSTSEWGQKTIEQLAAFIQAQNLVSKVLKGVTSTECANSMKSILILKLCQQC